VPVPVVELLEIVLSMMRRERGRLYRFARRISEGTTPNAARIPRMIQRARMIWATRTLDSFRRSSSSVVGASVEIYFSLEKSMLLPHRDLFIHIGKNPRKFNHSVIWIASPVEQPSPSGENTIFSGAFSIS